MTATPFKAIDARALDANNPLDTFILRRARSNLSAVYERRVFRGSWAGLALDGSLAQSAPRLCCHEDHACLMYPYTVRPGVTEITVTVRHVVGSNVTSGGDEVELLAEWYRIEDLRTGAAARVTNTVNLTGGASTASTTALTLDTTEAQGRTVIVMVGVRSYEGTEVEIQDSGGSGTNVFNDWQPGAFVLKDAASHTMNALGSLPEIALRVQVGGKDSSTAGEASTKRQCVRVLDKGSGDDRYKLFVHPPIMINPDDAYGSFFAEAAATLWYTPLGWLDLHQVLIHDSAVTPLRSAGGRIDATRGAGYRAIAAERMEQARVFNLLGNIRCMGPQPDLTQVDSTTVGNVPIERAFISQQLTASYATYARALVGRGHPFTQGGVDYVRALYRVTAVFAMTKTGDGGGYLWDMDLRLRLSDWSDAGTLVEVDSSFVEADAWPCAGVMESERDAGFQPGFDQWSRLRAFAFGQDQWANILRGLGPRSQVRSAFSQVRTIEEAGSATGSGLVFFSGLILDTEPDDRRMLSLQLKSNRTNARVDRNGRTHRFAPRVQLLAFTVTDDVQDSVNRLGDEIGARV